MCVFVFDKGICVVAPIMFLVSIVSQAVKERKQQESHPLEMQVLSPTCMDPDPFRLQLAPR